MTAARRIPVPIWSAMRRRQAPGAALSRVEAGIAPPALFGRFPGLRPAVADEEIRKLPVMAQNGMEAFFSRSCRTAGVHRRDAEGCPNRPGGPPACREIQGRTGHRGRAHRAGHAPARRLLFGGSPPCPHRVGLSQPR
ncbi:hypothetical protein GCM10010207_43850 [Streptomyces atratus]|nr:hypothetical protein GCM10010207_43850 [Streptomyces atratus]